MTNNGVSNNYIRSVGGLDGGSTCGVTWSKKERSKEGTAPVSRWKVN